METEGELLLSKEEKAVDFDDPRQKATQMQTSTRSLYLLFICFIIAVPLAYVAGASGVQVVTIGPVPGLCNYIFSFQQAASELINEIHSRSRLSQLDITSHLYTSPIERIELRLGESLSHITGGFFSTSHICPEPRRVRYVPSITLYSMSALLSFPSPSSLHSSALQSVANIRAKRVISGWSPPCLLGSTHGRLLRIRHLQRHYSSY